MNASKKIAMLIQSRYAIALVAVSTCVFGLASKSLAETFTDAGNGSGTIPAVAAAAVFSFDAEGKITEGAVSAAIGATSAAATASHVNDGKTFTNAASALGSTGQIQVNQNIRNGVINLTTK